MIFSMKILNSTIQPMNVRLAQPFSYALATLEHLPYLLISIELENKICGYGEAAVGWDTTGETQAGAGQMFDFIKPILKGKKIEKLKDIENILIEIETVIFGNTALKAGVEAALLDALGKLQKKPVFVLLGGKKKQPIILQKTFSFEDQHPDNINSLAKDAIANKVKILKLKADKDINRTCQAIRTINTIRPNAKIVLDVNQGWKKSVIAIPIMKRLEKYNLAWIEQPIHHADYQGLAEIRKKIKTPIMADESCHTLLDLENLYLRKSIDLVNIKLAKCGGILAAKKMIVFCDKHRIGYMLGDMLHSSLGTAMNLQAATLGNFISYDLTMPSRIKNDPFSGLTFDGFKAYIPNTVGLGVIKSDHAF
jgi:L-alanine-DL-glutamate epimerase-like enolase superfamily enzyme